MDRLSGRARLARNNINILATNKDRIVYEFQYRLPTTHSPVWHKTLSEPIHDYTSWAEQVLDEVRVLRRELEHGATE